MATWAVGKLAARLLGLPPSLVLTKAQYDTVDTGVGSGVAVDKGWGWGRRRGTRFGYICFPSERASNIFQVRYLFLHDFFNSNEFSNSY